MLGIVPSLRSPAPRLRAVFLLLASVATLALGGTGPFEGCSGGSMPAPRPLPRDGGESCFEDADCVPEGCEQLQCIAGRCTRTADIRDRDGDGHAPAPCGMDCDDADPAVAPGAREACDLVDQDCDGTTDEGAEPRAILHDLPSIDPTMTSVPWGTNELLVTDARADARSLRARRLALETGRLGASERALDLGPGEAVFLADAAPVEDGALLAVGLEMEGARTLLLVAVGRAADGSVLAAGEPMFRREVPELRAVDVAEIAGHVVLAWDEGARRRVWSPDWPGPVQVGEGLVEGLGPLDLATDGVHVVVPDGPARLAYLRPEDGTVAGTQRTSGELAYGAPVASAEGALFVVVRDAVAHSWQRVALGSAGRREIIPGDVGLGITIDVIPRGLLVTRLEASGTVAFRFNPADERDQQFFGASLIGLSRGVALDVEVWRIGEGATILTNYGEAGANLAVLACGTTG